ncbi:uncharacterized protein MELLADRAFT_104553 [Melampsora larici-populina 98AG31]|uniref:Uncharacterized protein n=1 Tax=Melampsora larici-populina (strain 98AG31 / pathotype 3-4-7) TaxID=747676 RepID=F4RF34_MELLP|nr:uncharacterized protein MELLADRAFT_104553 [Melampsora larici-populina 98AG31]EGG08746.1 hypothetical protein MELLADRAFT_104553 [Melampsora larici-populina 98AG31]
MAYPAQNTSSTPQRPPPNTQSPQSAQSDPYGDMRQLQARYASLNLDNTPASTPSPPKQKVQKPRSTPKKGPRDMYEAIDLSKIQLVLLKSCWTLTMVLMGRATAKLPFPPPPDQFYNRSIQQFISSEQDPDAPDAPSIPRHEVHGVNNHAGHLDHDYVEYIVGAMQTHNIIFFTMDWGAHIEDQFNQLMIMFFVKVWKWGLNLNRFLPAAKQEAIRINMDDRILAAIYVRHYKYLKTQYKKLMTNGNALLEEQARNWIGVALRRKTEERQKYLMAMGVVPCYVDAFKNRYVNSDDKVKPNPTTPDSEIGYSKVPIWQSEIATQFIDFVEKRRRASLPRIAGLRGKSARGNKLRPRQRRDPPVIDHDALAPPGLPEDWYSPAFLAQLTFEDILDLKMAPRMFPDSGNFLSIIPTTLDVTLYDKSGEASMPPHISNIPLSQRGPPMNTFPGSPEFQFINHPLFL